MMKRILFGALLSTSIAIGACDGSTVVFGGTGASASSSYPWDTTSIVAASSGYPGQTTTTGDPWQTTTTGHPGQTTTGGYGGGIFTGITTTSTYSGTGGYPVVGPGLTCASLYTVSPATSNWNTTLTQADFEPGTSYADYVALNTCVCVNKLNAQGCADLCKSGVDGSSAPNWCDGVGPTDVCVMCMDYYCAGAIDACYLD